MKHRYTAVMGLLVFAGCASTGSNGSSGGWNLLVPPITSAGNPALNEPLPRWQLVDKFSNPTDCQSYMARVQFGMHARFGPITQAHTPDEVQAVQILDGQCVSLNDPRLGVQ
jgi:hypothetical protein